MKSIPAQSVADFPIVYVVLKGNPVDISILLLAAGSSSRMGRPKQLLLVEGKPLLLRTLHIALASKANNTVVVLGHQAKEIQSILNTQPVSVIVNPQWENGMGNSFKFGLAEILKFKPDTSAVLTLVCDQPLLTTHHLDELLDTYASTGKPIITSGYSDVQGVPAIFDRSIFPELFSIDDHQGAKHVIEKNPNRIVIVPFKGGEVDLDTPEDYDSLITASE
jgi:molybdenum cofactor cytidylyltransferase